jgi:hypothetical protein
MSLFDRVFFKLTARRWNKVIASTLCQAKEVGCIDSYQLHTLTKEFDPTQSEGRIGRIVRGGHHPDLAAFLLQNPNVSVWSHRS